MKNFIFKSIRNLLTLISISCIICLFAKYQILSSIGIFLVILSFIFIILSSFIDEKFIKSNSSFISGEDSARAEYTNAFSQLTDSQNKAIEQIVMYVQKHGGGDTFFEMDDLNRMRLKTVIKEHDTDIAIDLGNVQLPNADYDSDTPGWKLEMEKIMDDLAIKVRELLGNQSSNTNTENKDTENKDTENKDTENIENNGDNK